MKYHESIRCNEMDIESHGFVWNIFLWSALASDPGTPELKDHRLYKVAVLKPLSHQPEIGSKPSNSHIIFTIRFYKLLYKQTRSMAHGMAVDWGAYWYRMKGALKSMLRENFTGLPILPFSPWRPGSPCRDTQTKREGEEEEEGRMRRENTDTQERGWKWGTADILGYN